MSTTKKAKAPRPGIGNRIAEADAASQVLAIRVKDETRYLGVGAVSMRDRQTIRNELGTTFEKVVVGLEDDPGPETLFVLWFLAGRQADPSLSFADEDVAFTALLPTLGEGDLGIEVVGADDSPEA